MSKSTRRKPTTLYYVFYDFKNYGEIVAFDSIDDAKQYASSLRNRNCPRVCYGSLKTTKSTVDALSELSKELLK